MDRAAFLAGTAAYALAGTAAPARLARLERRFGGRLGVAALDSATGARIAHRADERFPMCSTFKLLLTAATLSRIDAGRLQAKRRIRFTDADLLDYSPIVRRYAARGYVSVRALCEAAVEFSDNTAANLLLRTVDGPEAVTAYARSLGDSWTRLDRTEPTLNTAIPGDPRDTTTPAAMLATMRAILTGSALRRESRSELEAWLAACKTGTARIRAGVPAVWHVGDKTGTGDNGTSNDVAVLYPPNRAPIFVTAYYTGSRASSDARDAVLADVGRIVSSTFSGPKP